MERILCLLVLFALTAMSCGDGAPEVTQRDLIGHWSIMEGKRNDRPIATLQNAKFHFREDGKMSTNVLADDTYYSYQLEGNSIIETEGDKLSMSIEKYQVDTLTLSTTIQDDDFTLILLRSDSDQ